MYQCPKCEGFNISLRVLTWVNQRDGLVDDAVDTAEWDDQSPAQCADCGWTGIVGGLVTEAAVEEGETETALGRCAAEWLSVFLEAVHNGYFVRTPEGLEDFWLYVDDQSECDEAKEEAINLGLAWEDVEAEVAKRLGF